jgi:TrmH family RNA methyltransferase
MLSKSSAKYIQSLQHKKFRDEYGVFVAEGDKLVLEMIQSAQFEPVSLYAVEAWQAEHAASLKSVEHLIHTIPQETLERISGMPSPNKVLGVFRQKVWVLPTRFEGVTLMLDDLRDPGNLGTIIRTADWFGVQHILCSEQTVEVYNPKVVQSTMGSINRVQIHYTSLEQMVSMHSAIPLYAALLEGESVKNIQPKKPCFLMIGNEANGISPQLLSLPHHAVCIPGAGRAESLNAAIATSILLYHFTT